MTSLWKVQSTLASQPSWTWWPVQNLWCRLVSQTECERNWSKLFTCFPEWFSLDVLVIVYFHPIWSIYLKRLIESESSQLWVSSGFNLNTNFIAGGWMGICPQWIGYHCCFLNSSFNGKRQITLEFINAKKSHKIAWLLSYLLHPTYSLGYE